MGEARLVRLLYTRPALANLDAILDFIGEWSPAGAEKVKRRIQIITETLLSHPYVGVSTDDPTIRRMMTTPYPYVIFYEVAGEHVIIHAVRHAARDPSTMPSRANFSKEGR